MRRPNRLKILITLVSTVGALMCALSANADNIPKEEIESAIKFYGTVKADPGKLKVYCSVKDGIRMMTMGQEKFVQAQQQVAAGTKQLGPDFVNAQTLMTRLDMKSPDGTRYITARSALDQSCP